MLQCRAVTFHVQQTLEGQAADEGRMTTYCHQVVLTELQIKWCSLL